MFRVLDWWLMASEGLNGGFRLLCPSALTRVDRLTAIDLTYYMLRICVLHGPNLNLLGEQHEPGIYGSATLKDVNCALKDVASDLGVSLSHFQSSTTAN